MSKIAPPELLIIGDSHAIALKAGCDALSIGAGLLAASGNFWHSGKVVFDGETCIRIAGNRSLAAETARLRARLEGAALLGDLPLVVCAGFNLGRLVPRFMAEGHVASAEEFAAAPEAFSVSEAFLRAYLASHRGPQIALIRRLADRAPLVVVPPPLRVPSPTWTKARAIVAELMREAGLTVCDAAIDLAEHGQALDPSFFAEDGIHGNARYGRAVIEMLIERGAFRRQLSKAK